MILIQYFFLLIVLTLAAFLNWIFPLYKWSDTPVMRFIWLGLFFLFLDIFIEIVLKIVEKLRLMREGMGLAIDLKKIEGFHVIPKVQLPNNSKADFCVVGSSGVWMVQVKNDNGEIGFDGDEITQDGVILKGLLSMALQKSYSLAGFLKEKLSKDITVTPVIAFSSPRADLSSMQKNVRNVYVVARKDLVQLIENTDVQLIDKNTIEEIYKTLKK